MKNRDDWASNESGITRDPCIIWSTSPEGKVQPLCTIARDQYYEINVRAAETFYNFASKGKAIISFEVNHAARLGLRSWRDISSKMTDSFLATLSERGVSSEVLLLVRDNLDIVKSFDRFSELVVQKFGASTIRSEVERAHDIASVGHANDSFARPQDTVGLFHIPYMQHPRNIAILAMEHNLSSRAVMAALLHDVVEDSKQPQELTIERLRLSFDSEVCEWVVQLTKKSGQSRTDFLRHIEQLSGELAVVKALDRYDNLIRAYGLQDPGYHGRLLDECGSTYDRIYEREAALEPLRKNYELLKKGVLQYRGILR